MTQLDLALGLALKQEGIGKVAQNNETWLGKMRAFAKRYCLRYDSVTSDHLRLYALEYGVGEPLHQNAWGAIFQGPQWKVIGRTKSKIPSNHGREIRIWRWIGD